MGKTIKRLKEKAETLKHEITALYYAYQNPDLKRLPKIFVILTVGYALSPLDLIPDFIPVLGYLDDLIILPALIMISIKLIPHEIMNSAHEQAKSEPISLKKNWIFASVFVLWWLLILFVIGRSLLKIN